MDNWKITPYEQRKNLQRLFPAFPGGRPGLGLLLLRMAVGLTAIIREGVYLNNHAQSMIVHWVVGCVVIAAGASVLIGFLTPLMAALTGIAIIGTSLFHLPEWTLTLLVSKPSEILVLAIAAAIVFLGPGAFSVDARLFGHREIIIPPSSRSRRS